MLVAVTIALAGCGGHDPQSTASDVTRAVYDNDLRGVTARVDQALLPQVSRANVGAISDKMHALGSYNGLTPIASDPVKNEYTYRASFAKGTMNVVIRLDSDGKLAAYRVFPQS
ncbi:MAG TPA: hypothetical protein VIK27_12575 [Candidatus Aquilonibacter sp.]